MYERRFRAAMALCGRSYSYDRNDGRRWLSRDPLGEEGGLNLYEYVGNDPLNYFDLYGLDETFWIPDHGRSWSDGPRNGNWGGKNWSGGKGPNETGPDLPPTDSGDAIYMLHDKAYDAVSCPADTKKADADLVARLKALPDDPKQWPLPPRAGTEGDSSRYRKMAILYFGP